MVIEDSVCHTHVGHDGLVVSYSSITHSKPCANCGQFAFDKVKIMSICIAPIHETSLLLRHSDIAPIVKRYHISFTCISCVSSASGVSHIAFAFPAVAGI